MTLLVPLCMTLACTKRLEKKTLSWKGRMYMSVRCFQDLRLGRCSASLRERRVHAAHTTRLCCGAIGNQIINAANESNRRAVVFVRARGFEPGGCWAPAAPGPASGARVEGAAGCG
jgi:hypothetical protein